MGEQATRQSLGSGNDNFGAFDAFLQGNVFVCEFKGFASDPLSKQFLSALSLGLERGAAHLFVDFEGLTGYAPSLRSGGVDILRAKHSQLASVHVLSKSSIVRMGVTMAALVIKALRLHGSRKEFDTAMLALNSQPR
jgi:hypothetical protein